MIDENDTDDSLPARYVSKFGELPPIAYWHGSAADLDRAMESAILTGRKLTEDEMYRVQGVEPPPPGAKT